MLFVVFLMIKQSLASGFPMFEHFHFNQGTVREYIDGPVQDCSNSIANALELMQSCTKPSILTHWGLVTHICVDKLIINGSDNGLSPGRRQAIIWTSAGILLIGPLGTNFSEILMGIQTFSFKKMRLEMSSTKLNAIHFVSASMC